MPDRQFPALINPDRLHNQRTVLGLLKRRVFPKLQNKLVITSEFDRVGREYYPKDEHIARARSKIHNPGNTTSQAHRVHYLRERLWR